MNQSTSKPIPFESGWYSFVLAPYRPCEATYYLYPYGGTATGSTRQPDSSDRSQRPAADGSSWDNQFYS